ncbi:MAG TPA: helix-hairpin-helix domain-containing protein, partial [Terriglobales bacterium]|nr:helix-hairpin-helix domain-containing protein [Terriglobales bacterium]
GEGLIEKLSAAGVTTVESLADMTPEQLEAIEGIGPKTVEKISLAVNNYFAGLESGESIAAPAEGEEIPAEAVAEESAANAEGAGEPAEAATEEAAAEDSASSEASVAGEAAEAGEAAGQADSPGAAEEFSPSEDKQEERN